MKLKSMNKLNEKLPVLSDCHGRYVSFVPICLFEGRCVYVYAWGVPFR